MCPVYYGTASSVTAIVTPRPDQVPVSIGSGDTVTLFNAETVVAGTASIPFTVMARPQGSPAPAMSFELVFSAAPGAFEVDIQESAATDADGCYVTPSNTTYQITAVNATTFVATADVIPTGGKFMRALVKTLTNAVKTTVKATCLA